MNVAAQVTRRVEIAGMQLIVLDGLFSDEDIRSLYKFLRDLPYQLNDITSHETAYAKHWKADFPPALAQGIVRYVGEPVAVTEKLAVPPADTA